MASITRGKALQDQHARGRGQCPLCFRTGIKLLYEQTDQDGNVVRVCKNCRPAKRLKKHAQA